MSLFKRPDSAIWWVEFEYKTERYRQTTGTTDKKAAREVEKKLRADVHAEVTLGIKAPKTLKEAIDSYFKVRVKPTLTTNLKSTAKSTQYRLEALLDHFGEKTKLTDITSEKLSEFKVQLITEGKKPATVNRHLTMLRAVLYYAKEELHALKEVPTFTKEDEDEGRVKFLTDEEERYLLAVSTGDFKDLIMFLMDTGGRRGDALQLLWSEVNLSGKPGEVQFTKTKTDKPRGVPLTSRVREMLDRRFKDRTTDKVFPYDPVTLTRDGGRKGAHGRPKIGSTKGLRQAWKDALKAALKAMEEAHQKARDQGEKVIESTSNLVGFRLHDLRHHFASRLVRKGVPLLNVGELLGHSDPSVTKRYAHLNKEALTSSINNLN